MERRMNKVTIGILLSISLGFMLIFSACDNSLNIYEAVTNKVMAANSKFLVVTAVTPAKNALRADPSSDITITFDRDIDETTANELSIIITPAIDYEKTFFSATKTLVIDPVVAFEGGIYTVQLTKGIKGKDNSALQTDYTWSFDTAKLPGGSITIGNGSGFINEVPLITVTGIGNSYAHWYRFSLNGDLGSVVWNEITSTDNTFSFGITLNNSLSDGPQKIYYQFTDEEKLAANNSQVLFKAVTLDRQGPIINVGSDRAPTNRSLLINTTVTDALSGVDPNSYAWTYELSTSAPIPPVGAVVNFQPANAKDTYVLPTKDGKYRITLTAKDKLGNSSSASCAITLDTVGPTPFVFSKVTMPTKDPESVEWYWEAAETGDDTFIYQLDGEYKDLWSDKTDATSYRPKEPLTGGAHTLYVKERDSAGNWSTISGSFTVHIDTARDLKQIVPAKDAFDVPRYTDFDWPVIRGIGIYYVFHIFSKGDSKNDFLANLPISYIVNDPKGPQAEFVTNFRKYIDQFKPETTFIWQVIAVDNSNYITNIVEESVFTIGR